MRTNFLLLSLVFLSFLTAAAQEAPSTTQPYCVSYEQLETLLTTLHPELAGQQKYLDSAYARDIGAATTHRPRSTSPTALYVIPVVVHIIHNNGSENISDATVIQGIQDLNDAYANIGYYDSTTGVDTRIQFCLAKRDPNGNITTGITRNVSTYTNMTLETDDLNVKNLNRWNTSCYLNMWLVKEICSNSGGCGVAGYAYFPSAVGSNIDGLVAEARWFGSSRAASGVHIHEVGHYLGLYHTFQGGCTNNNCLNDGDHVCDTPPDGSTAAVPCSAAPNSCSTDAQSGFTTDQPDLFQDYMDYGDFHCYSVFTQGQSDRMHWTLDHVRSGMLACRSCLSPCTSPAVARFTSSSHAVLTGASVTFTNTSTNATSYTWAFNGINFSSATNPTYTFTAPGTFIIQLTANNTDPNCFDQKLDTIIVTCSAQAGLTYPGKPAAVGPNTPISFTSTSTGATSYQWSMNGIQFATTANATYTFPSNGTYWVRLTASNAYCSSVDSFRMFVCNPCVEICDNGVDDDGNNLFDCIDASCSCTRCSPKHANNWYFGLNAAITFNTSPPSVITTSQMYQNEATASISDANGRLLFYTNGITVWNRNNQVMPNGTGLIGDGSSTSCLIVPHPGNSALYYIFHTGSSDAPNTKGFRYTIVDMRLNYGMGDVVVASKNTSILSASLATEKIAAVRHCNNKSIWVATHEFANNKFDAYLVDSTGFHATPVVSQVGTTFANSGNVIDYIGFLKFSADGKRAANTLNNSAKVDVLDFNNSTGIFSNALTITATTSPTNYFYGLEFSPNGKILYAVTQYNSSHIYQYDLTQTTSASLTASQYTLATLTSPLMYSAAQMGPDGKMYFSIASSSSATHSQYIASVTYPNVRGAGCRFNPNGLNLGAAYCNFGLPCFIQNYFITGVSIDGPDSICGTSQNQRYTLIGEKSCEAITNWSIVSGDAYIYSHSDTSATIHFNSNGVVGLAVDVSNTCNAGTDTITISNMKAANLDLGPDTTECYAGVTVLNAHSGFRSYLWQDGSTDSVYTAYGAGSYWCRIQDYCGNIATDTVHVGVDSTTRISLGSDTLICKGHAVTLSATNLPGGSYIWSPNYAISSTSAQVVTVTPLVTTTYSVAVRNKEGCTTLASRTINVSECTGIIGLAADLGIDVRPNPAHAQVTVMMTDVSKVNAVAIYTDLGQVAYRTDRRPDASVTFDISGLARGVYFATVTCTDGSQVTKRFIKD